MIPSWPGIIIMTIITLNSTLRPLNWNFENAYAPIALKYSLMATEQLARTRLLRKPRQMLMFSVRRS